MGKLNEVQEQTTQSYGSNSFTTRIKENTVEFDSAKDKFTFLDPVEVPGINIGGTASVPFTSEDRAKLDNLQTPMQIKGRVDSVGDLPTEGVSVGDTYLVGLSGSDTFDEYVCVGLSGSPEAPVWESVGKTQAQADWNQNNNTASDYVKNRTHYVEVSMSTVFNDDIAVTAMQQDNLYLYQGQTELTEDFEIEVGQTYNVTKDGVEYEIVATEYQYTSAIIYGNPEDLEVGSFAIVAQRQFGGPTELVIMGISSSEVSSVSLMIDAPTETVHQLDDKYISDNIARTDDIPEVAFNIDESNYNIYPTFTNTTNEIKSTLQQSLIACAPAASNCVFDGGTNVFLGSAVYANKMSGSTNIGISSNSGMEVSGSNNIAINSNGGSNKVSGGSNIMITSGAAALTVGGQSNTVISSFGGSCTISDNEIGSILIGQCANIKLQNGGYQKLALNPQYGSELNADHSTIICGGGKVNSVNSSIISNQSTSNNIYGANSLIIGGGQTGTANIATSETSNSTTMCNIICSGNGNSTITSGAGNNIIGCCGGTFAVNGGANNNIIGFSGSGTIQSNQYNMILGGYGSVTIPSSVSNCIVIGAATSSPTESNMVYVPALNAVNGVKTKKMTIAGIDPADVFMHSEIIDASSDVAFSRVIANTASTKTDGYVEILYKASSGVTCSAYIDSADVALTADGAWHKLEQGCNPANGVEIHINNSSPVTDATLEVISKVYYI